MRISFNELKIVFQQILLEEGFPVEKAEYCAAIFANNSLDGVYSHGVNRFPVFIQSLKDGLVKIEGEAELVEKMGVIERYDGNLGPGMLNADYCIEQAMSIANKMGMGCVAIRNTNHWMRGGTYGWKAAEAGYIAICFTNTIANMPPWGGVDPRLGNNPLIIAVPRKEGHIVLDMAMTQYSFGKLQEYDLKGESLAVSGGYDENGQLSQSPSAILNSRRTLPIGFWKGSGLSLLLDLLVTLLSKGSSTAKITASEKESGVSQVFIAIKQEENELSENIINEVIKYTRMSTPVKDGEKIYYPGEKTLLTRKYNLENGIPVEKEIWDKINSLL